MDAAATGLRLHLRQTAVRPPARRSRPAGARAFPRRARITRTSWPAFWKTTTSRGPPQPSRREMHEAAAVITFLSPGLRFFHQGQFEGRKTRISPHLVRGSGRTDRPAAGTVLRPAAGRVAPAGRPRWPMAIARLLPRLGRQLDLGLLSGLCLARACRRAAAGDGELCAQPEPVLRRCRSRISVTASGAWRIYSVTPPTTGRATICKHVACTSMSLPGRPPSFADETSLTGGEKLAFKPQPAVSSAQDACSFFESNIRALSRELQLLAYLRANGFKTFIVSGGDVDFMHLELILPRAVRRQARPL